MLQNFKITQALSTSNYHKVNMHVLDPNMISVAKFYLITIKARQHGLGFDSDPGEFSFEAAVAKVEFKDEAVKLVLNVAAEAIPYISNNLEYFTGGEDSPCAIELKALKSSNLNPAPDTDIDEDEDENEGGPDEDAQPRRSRNRKK